jgi:hypothetical protein
VGVTAAGTQRMRRSLEQNSLLVMAGWLSSSPPPPEMHATYGIGAYVVRLTACCCANSDHQLHKSIKRELACAQYHTINSIETAWGRECYKETDMSLNACVCVKIRQHGNTVPARICVTDKGSERRRPWEEGGREGGKGRRGGATDWGRT